MHHLIAIRTIEYINNSFYIFATIIHENIRKTITITVSDFAPYLFVNLNDTFKDDVKFSRSDANKLISLLRKTPELKHSIYKTEFVKKKLAYGFDFDKERDFVKIYLKNYEYSKKQLADTLTSINAEFPLFTLRTYNDDISAQALFLLETNLKYHTVYQINLQTLTPNTSNQFTTNLAFEANTLLLTNLTPSQDKLFLPITIMAIRSAIYTQHNTAPSLELHTIEPITAISTDFYTKDSIDQNPTIHKLRINTQTTTHDLKINEHTHEPNESYTFIDNSTNPIINLIEHITTHDPDIIIYLRDNIEDMAHIITRYPEGQFSRIIGTAATCNKSPMKDIRTIKIPGRNTIDLSSFLPNMQVNPKMDAFDLHCIIKHEKFKYPNKKELSIHDHAKYNFSTIPPERITYELDIQTTIIRRISIHVGIINDILPISTICNLPISTIASSGQTIRVFNVLAKYALSDNLVFNCELSERPIFTLNATLFNSFPKIPIPNETLFEHKDQSEEEEKEEEYQKPPTKYTKIKHGKVKTVPIKKMPGGFVHNNIPGFYDKYPILLLDFNSLYPTIFIGYHCCTRLYIRSQEILDKILAKDPNAEIMYVNTHENYSVAYVKKINGIEQPNIYPKMESELLANRNKVKSLMKQFKEGSTEYNNLDKQQAGNKVIQNAAYGFTNAKKGSFVKHTFLFLLGTITAIGRWLNRRMTRIVYDKFNGITVGGDTDSVFVQVKDATHQIQAKTQSHEERMKEYFNLCEIIANTCSEGLPYPVKIGVDGIYMSLIISTRKKCYVAFEYSNPTNFKVKHQGVQYKKRDRAPFVRKNAAHIVELILNNKKHEVKPFITNLLNQLIKLEIPKEQFIITQLYKGTDNYKVKNLPIITVVNTMKSQNLNVYPGDRIPYIITYNPNKKNIYQKAEIPNINNPKQIPDYLHYLKSLESSLDFCFEYVDCNFNWHTLIQSYYIKLNNILTAKSNPNPLTNYFQSLKSKSLH